MQRDYIYGEKAALVVVDPQRKFSLPTEDWEQVRDKVVPEINRYAKLFREHGLPVIFIAFQGPAHIPYPGADGDEWLQGIETAPTDIVVKKENMSCFKQTDLEEILKERKVDHVFLAGMLAEYCVTATYFSAIERSIGSVVLPSALIAYKPEGLEAVKVLLNWTPDDVLMAYFEGRQGPPPEIM